MPRILTIALVVCLAAAKTAAQETASASDGSADGGGVFSASEPARALKIGKIVHALRITGEPPSIDGRLNDEVWMAAESASGFVQRDPDNGRPSSEETRVQIAYDNRFLYVAVTCLDSAPQAIARGLGRRDETPPTDYVTIGLDPRHDHLTGYAFQTNPSGWQGDFSLFDDDNTDRDYNVNWDVRTQITDAGWTAEFRVPFSQMRFTAQPTPGQVWGFNTGRQIRRKNEFGMWVARPRGERGDVSLFGHLVFDAPLAPPGRLEITPYALSRAQRDPAGSGDLGLSAGADVRYGLGPGATLSATINPDFGQVEQDPAVLNLSIYETFFPEKRPFFLEDSRTFIPPYGLFQLFHSRRIGRTPDRFPLASDDVVLEQPADTTILGAAKLTGKSAGWTYGALTAMTGREYADVETTTIGVDGAALLARRSRLIEPATSYNVARIQHDLRGSSNVGAIATGVVREKTADAFTGGFDYNLRWDRNRTNFNGHWVMTHAPGDGGVKTDGGGVTNFNVNHKYWNLGLHADHFGRNFRVSDIGFFRARANRNQVSVSVEFGQPDPGKHLRSRWTGINTWQGWNAERLVFERAAESYTFIRLLNYWGGHLGIGHNFDAYDDLDTRGGPIIARPGSSYAFFGLESDSRKSWRLNVNGNGFWSDSRGAGFTLNPRISLQASDRLQFSASTRYEKGNDTAQWIRNEDVDSDGVTDYVYGTLHRNVLDVTFRATYAFTRDLTLQAYTQPFVAVGDYINTRRLARPRTYDFDPVALTSDPDFNDKSLRSNVVLRWEYVRGSTLFVVWNLAQSDSSRPGVFAAWRDLGSAFSGSATNVFMVKATYWLNR